MTPFSGLKVLVVEDEGTIAMLIEEMLEDLGCVVVASVARLAKASAVARSIDVDMAILDVNLAGELAFPVAEILRDRNVPFLFSTGYGVTGLRDEFSLRPVLHKPFSLKDLEEKIGIALAVTHNESAKDFES